MGIFRNKQPVATDDQAIVATDPNTPTRSPGIGSIDGIRPSTPIPVNDNFSATAPPLNNSQTDDSGYIMTDPPAPAQDVATEPTPPEAVPAPVAQPEPTEQPSVLPLEAVKSTDDLAAIKQQALMQLSPLVDHLEQTPEEKFQTTMMMLQATDDQTLVKPAYEAAQAIADEKVRARALLDIVNEINYFTQSKR